MSNDSWLKFFKILLASFTVLNGYCQDNSIQLIGKVQSINTDISNVLIVNSNTKESTITDATGFFSLQVRLNDTLQFSAVHYVTEKIIITKIILNQKTIVVDLKEKIVHLDEVVIVPNNLTGQVAFDLKKLDTKPSVTSSSLGLPKANVKAKTKNERLLFESDHGKFAKMKGSPFGVGVSLNTHKIMNRISGKTKALKNRILLDEYIKIEKQILNLFSKKVLSEELGIPQIDIENFLNFCLSQTDFPKSSKTINALQVLEYFKDKSYGYKKAKGLN